MDSADTRKTIVLIIGWAFFVLGCPPPLSVDGDERDGGIGGNSPGNGGAAQGGSAGSGAGAPGVGGANSGGSAGVGGSGQGHGGAEPVPDAGADAGDAGPTILPPPNCGAFDATCISTNRRQLPAPCQGIPYSETLEAVGGTAPFHWSITPEPAQYELQSPEARTVTIVSKPGSPPTTAETLHVTLSDSADPPHVVEVDYELPLRESCWFAYLSSDDPERPLHVRDVFLHHDIAPTTGVEAAGIDFKFSPDGRWIAFRVATAAGPRLFTYDANARGNEALATGFECPDQGGGDAGVAATCGVVDYAWSSDSNQLAAVLRDEDAQRDFVALIAGYGDGAPGAASPPKGDVNWLFVPQPVQYGGQLVWGDSRWVGFLSVRPELALPLPNPEEFPLSPVLGHATPTSAGAAPLSDTAGDLSTLAPVGSLLLPVNGGAILAMPEDAESVTAALLPYPDFDPLSGGPASLAHASSWLSPSRRWAARTTENQSLEIYALAEPTIAAAATAGGVCEAVMAWSQPLPDGRELLACRAGPLIQFTAVSQDGQAIQVLGNRTAEIGLGMRRAFSPDGRWFVYGHAIDSLHDYRVLNLASSLDVLTSFESPGPVELAFPPTRPFLMLSHAGILREIALDPAALPSAFFTTAAERSSCAELSAAPNWCGAPSILGHVRYSGDSLSALLDDEGSSVLYVAEPGVSEDPDRVTNQLALCTIGCVGTVYGFLP